MSENYVELKEDGAHVQYMEIVDDDDFQMAIADMEQCIIALKESLSENNRAQATFLSDAIAEQSVAIHAYIMHNFMR